MFDIREEVQNFLDYMDGKYPDLDDPDLPDLFAIYSDPDLFWGGLRPVSFSYYRDEDGNVHAKPRGGIRTVRTDPSRFNDYVANMRDIATDVRYVTTTDDIPSDDLLVYSGQDMSGYVAADADDGLTGRVCGAGTEFEYTSSTTPIGGWVHYAVY